MLTAETWVELIGTCSQLSEMLYVDAAALNQAISKDNALAMDCSNVGVTR
jgi:hypothetical protein